MRTYAHTHLTPHTHQTQSNQKRQVEEKREEEEGMRLYWDRPFGCDWVQVQCKEVNHI